MIDPPSTPAGGIGFGIRGGEGRVAQLPRMKRQFVVGGDGKNEEQRKSKGVQENWSPTFPNV